MRKKLRFLSATALTFFMVAPAYAAGSGMPWEEPLQRILESVQGPVAKIVAVIIIIITGLTLAFGETSGGFRRLIQIVFGLSIATVLTLVFTPAMLALRVWFNTYLHWIARALAALSLGAGSRAARDWALTRAARRVKAPTILWEDLPNPASARAASDDSLSSLRAAE